MKEIDYYITCSNTRIQQSKIDKALKRYYKEDYKEDQIQELADLIKYCCCNYNDTYGCQCKYLPECKLFNRLILKYADVLNKGVENG